MPRGPKKAAASPSGSRPRLTERRWVNPYVTKLKELPALILGSEQSFLTEEERERLRALVRGAPSVFVELGSGSGGHLVEQAARKPESLWVGVELRFKRLVRTAEKAKQRELSNVLVVRTDARDIPELLGPAAVDGVFINFPDPWDKRRWKKHRLLGEESLAALTKLIKPRGIISFKSDHREYFEQVISLVHASGWYALEVVSLDLTGSSYQPSNVPTEFEQLFISKRLPIHYMVARRRELPPAGEASLPTAMR